MDMTEDGRFNTVMLELILKEHLEDVYGIYDTTQRLLLYYRKLCCKTTTLLKILESCYQSNS